MSAPNILFFFYNKHLNIKGHMSFIEDPVLRHYMRKEWTFLVFMFSNEISVGNYTNVPNFKISFFLLESLRTIEYSGSYNVPQWRQVSVFSMIMLNQRCIYMVLVFLYLYKLIYLVWPFHSYSIDCFYSLFPYWGCRVPNNVLNYTSPL